MSEPPGSPLLPTIPTSPAPLPPSSTTRPSLHTAAPAHAPTSLAQPCAAVCEPCHVEHSLMGAALWQERPQLSEVCEWWRRGVEGVCALEGFGGNGKTAVVVQFLRRLPGAPVECPGVAKDSTLPVPSALLMFSFYSAPNADKFAESVHEWLVGTSVGQDGKESFSWPGAMLQLEKLGHAARRRKEAGVLLVLDGLEKVQEDGLRGSELGKLEDGRLRELVQRAARGMLAGVRVLVTSRFRLYDAIVGGHPEQFRQILVDQLDLTAAVQLLKAHEVDGTQQELQHVAESAGLHALSVDLTGGFIATFCRRKAAALPAEWHMRAKEEAAASEDPQNELDASALRVLKLEQQFAHIAEQYCKRLEDSAPVALILMHWICLLRLGVGLPLLQKICAAGPATPNRPASPMLRFGETLRGFFTGAHSRRSSELRALSAQEVQNGVKVLCSMHLAESSMSENGRELVYSVHPAVRDAFLRGMRADARAVRVGSAAACDGLLSSVPGGTTKPRDRATLDVLEEVVYDALAAGEPDAAWDVYWNRMGNVPHLAHGLGAFALGERICRAFADAAGAQLGKWGGDDPAGSKLFGWSVSRKALFWNEWGVYLFWLGCVRDALWCYQCSNRIEKAAGDSRSLSVGKQNTSGLLAVCGRLSDALADAEEALQLAGTDKRVCRNGLAQCGQVRGLLGADVAHALEDFAAARKHQNDTDGNDDPLYGGKGVDYGRLLARTCVGGVDAKDALALMERMIAIHTKLWGTDQFSIPMLRGVVAELHVTAGLEAAGALAHVRAYRDWAVARDARQELCEAERVAGVVALAYARECGADQMHQRTQQEVEEACEEDKNRQKQRQIEEENAEDEEKEQLHNGRASELGVVLRKAEKDVSGALQIAQMYGFVLLHIDLCVVRAMLRVRLGDTAGAEVDARTALFGPPNAVSDNTEATAARPGETGAAPRASTIREKVELFGAASAECRYRWGEAAGRHALAEVLLARAGAELGRTRFDREQHSKRSSKVLELLSEAQKEVDACVELRKQLKDRKLKETEELSAALALGELPEYSLLAHRVRLDSGPARDGQCSSVPSGSTLRLSTQRGDSVTQSTVLREQDSRESVRSASRDGLYESLFSLVQGALDVNDENWRSLCVLCLVLDCEPDTLRPVLLELEDELNKIFRANVDECPELCDQAREYLSARPRSLFVLFARSENGSGIVVLSCVAACVVLQQLFSGSRTELDGFRVLRLDEIGIPRQLPLLDASCSVVAFRAALLLSVFAGLSERVDADPDLKDLRDSVWRLFVTHLDHDARWVEHGSPQQQGVNEGRRPCVDLFNRVRNKMLRQCGRTEWMLIVLAFNLDVASFDAGSGEAPLRRLRVRGLFFVEATEACVHPLLQFVELSEDYESSPWTSDLRQLCEMVAKNYTLPDNRVSCDVIQQRQFFVRGFALIIKKLSQGLLTDLMICFEDCERINLVSESDTPESAMWNLYVNGVFDAGKMRAVYNQLCKVTGGVYKPVWLCRQHEMAEKQCLQCLECLVEQDEELLSRNTASGGAEQNGVAVLSGAILCLSEVAVLYFRTAVQYIFLYTPFRSIAQYSLVARSLSWHVQRLAQSWPSARSSRIPSARSTSDGSSSDREAAV